MMEILDKIGEGQYDWAIPLLLCFVAIGFLWAGLIKTIEWWNRRVDRQVIAGRLTENREEAARQGGKGC